MFRKDLNAKAKGLIIAIEGIDGGGKSTLAHAIEEYLTARDIECSVITSQCLADLDDVLDVKELTESASSGAIDPLTMSLFRCAEMAQRWRGIARPALKAGNIVIFDRYDFTPLVRDVLRGVPERYVRAMYSFLPPPHLLLYLDVTPRIALDRKVEAGIPLGEWESGADLLPKEDLPKAFVSFQGLCRRRYKKILPRDTVMVDARNDADWVWKRVRREVAALIK